MDYEKAYKEVLSRAKTKYDSMMEQGVVGMAENIAELFPELKESEDEQPRKWILEYLYDGLRKSDEQFKDQFKCAIAWFEKQGEQKPTLPVWKYKKDHTPLLIDSFILNKYGCVAESPSGSIVSDVWVLDFDALAKLPKEEFEKQGSQNLANSAQTCKDEPKFPGLSEKEIVCLKRILDFLREEHNSYTGKDFTNEIAVLEWLITHPVLIHSSELQPNQGEQNPAWSEEDEKMVGCIRVIIEKYAFSQSAVDVNGDLCEREFIEPDEWLKSLKERYTWKPSDEQMSQLECVAMQNKDNMLGKELMTLFNDLKKLRG